MSETSGRDLGIEKPVILSRRFLVLSLAVVVEQERVTDINGFTLVLVRPWVRGWDIPVWRWCGVCVRAPGLDRLSAWRHLQDINKSLN